MNIKKYIALSLMISFFISFTIAQDVGTIMNTSVTLALQGVKDLKSGLDKVTQELFELDARERAKNENLDERYRQARNEIVRVINGIEETTSIISQSIERLAVYQVQMKSIIDEMNVLKTSSSSAKEYLSEYMNLLYKMQLELYGYEGEAINDLRLLITSNNINQTLVSSEITAAMTLQLNDLLSQAEVAEEKNLILLNRLGHLKQQAQLTLNSYRDEIEKLQQKKQYLLSFIELYKNEQIASSQRFNKVFTSKREVHLAIQIFLDEIVKKDYKSVEGIATKISQLSQLPDARNKDTIAQVARPVYPIEQILRYYNDPQFELSYGFKHQAIQIQAVQRSPVYAARDGVVYHTFDNMDSISRVMIVHQEGYVTTYQYLNQIIVQPGDVVTRGEIIWYSGGEPGTKGAGFISEGENLTFGVYRYGLPVDPLTVLDLSAVTDRENVIPDEYRLKYLNDHILRPINVIDLKFAEGRTVNERSQNFLSAYAQWVYRDLYFRDSVVEWTNIDRDMVICVAFAESTLGRYLSTANNIGNVGNNDRGDRIAYTSPYEGTRLIALTLNNAYLGHYHTINQLSRYGNVDGMIYASSPINRQTNVLKCLSKIKGYTIPEDFPFRTGPNPNRNPLS